MVKKLLETIDLCKSFANDGTQNHVLNNVDLCIYEDDFTACMGASGSGKSTLLYCMSGMDRATTGAVIYGGMDIVRASESQINKLRSGDFGFIFQQSHLVPNLTLWENIVVPGYLGAKRAGKTNEHVDERAREYVRMLEIEDAKDRYPNQVSGGQQQRCAIARAIINEARLLFADEPTGALNRANSEAALDLLTALNKQGQSIFMVTHDVKSAIRANRLVYLDDGRIVGEMSLPPYSRDMQANRNQAREEQVNAWLSSLNW